MSDGCDADRQIETSGRNGTIHAAVHDCRWVGGEQQSWQQMKGAAECGGRLLGLNYVIRKQAELQRLEKTKRSKRQSSTTFSISHSNRPHLSASERLSLNTALQRTRVRHLADCTSRQHYSNTPVTPWPLVHCRSLSESCWRSPSTNS